MKKRISFLLMGVLGFALSVLSMPSMAQSQSAHPMGFPEAMSSIANEVTDLYNFVFWITAVIFVLVQAVLLICIWKFRRSKRKKAATFHHNTPLEIAWTIVPAIICFVIAWKSFDTMHFIRTMPKEGLTVEVIAHQFRWDFDYPDLGISAPEPSAPHAQLSSAGVERYVKEMVVPVGANIKANITASDVIHAFFVPNMGIKIDAMPGRINYQWFNPTKAGEYIGQCAELCGSAHTEMFFVLKVLEQDDFARWVNVQRQEAGLEAMAQADILAAMR